MKFQAENIFSHYHSNLIYHPVIAINSTTVKKQKNVFISSRNLTRKQLIDICELESQNTVICNKIFNNVLNRNLKMGYIKDFDEMLNSCSKVYITGDYKFRASGILYKSISINDLKIYLTDKSYYQELVDRFKNLNNKFVLIEN